jgi:hypothetical protein
MNGYDRKTLTLSHKETAPVTIAIEVDVTGYGDWKVYQSFEVPSGKQVTHRFPDGFSAYWVRAVSQTETTATAQLRYE